MERWLFDWYLASLLLNCFCDNNYLNTGLKRSRYFVALISRSGLAKVRDELQDHTYDNVLLEYETALKVRVLLVNVLLFV